MDELDGGRTEKLYFSGKYESSFLGNCVLLGLSNMAGDSGRNCCVTFQEMWHLQLPR